MQGRPKYRAAVVNYVTHGGVPDRGAAHAGFMLAPHPLTRPIECTRRAALLDGAAQR
jgi:hypothetical protein